MVIFLSLKYNICLFLGLWSSWICWGLVSHDCMCSGCTPWVLGVSRHCAAPHMIYGMHHKSEASASMHLGWPQSSINFTTCGVHNALCVGALSLLLHLFYIHFPHLVIVASTLFFKTPPFYSSYFFSVFCFLFFVIIAALCCYILNNNCEAAVHSSNLGSITVTT